MSVNEVNLVVEPGSEREYPGWILLNWGSRRECKMAFPVTQQIGGKRNLSTWIKESGEL